MAVSLKEVFPEEFKPPRFHALDDGTLFIKWWTGEKKSYYSGVPECIVEQWLFRNWAGTPYDWLPVFDYHYQQIDFNLEAWPTVSSLMNDWDYESSLEHGERTLQTNNWLTNYVRSNGRLPRPPVLVDNRDGHLQAHNSVRADGLRVPFGIIVVEGHSRYNLVSYLGPTGKLGDTVKVWLLSANIGRDLKKRDVAPTR